MFDEVVHFRGYCKADKSGDCDFTSLLFINLLQLGLDCPHLEELGTIILENTSGWSVMLRSGYVTRHKPWSME